MPIAPRADFDAAGLRAAARRTKDAAQARRLLALAAIYDGASRTEAARIGGVTVQIVRDWVVRFNAQGPAGLLDRKAPAGSGIAADQYPPCGPGGGARERSDTGHPRRGAVAAGRSLPMAVGGASGHGRQADHEPRGAGARLPQALSAAASSCAGGRRHREF